nr:EF-hand domain-containing protein [Streptomyces sp. SID12501]
MHPDVIVRGVSATSDAIFDLDGDGQLDQKEFARMMGGFHLPPDAAQEAFGRTDQDGDGAIGRDEFRQATIDLYTGDDPHAPGNWLAGRGTCLRRSDLAATPSEPPEQHHQVEDVMAAWDGQVVSGGIEWPSRPSHHTEQEPTEKTYFPVPQSNRPDLRRRPTRSRNQ